VETKTLAILVAATMSAVGILGDYFLKRASEAQQPLTTRTFLVGFVLYASMRWPGPL
jgi:small multidrug resistance pump